MIYIKIKFNKVLKFVIYNFLKIKFFGFFHSFKIRMIFENLILLENDDSRFQKLKFLLIILNVSSRK
jgi:hypothetical protein